MVSLSDYEHLRYEQRGPVTVITINRPERKLPAAGARTGGYRIGAPPTPHSTKTP